MGEFSIYLGFMVGLVGGFGMFFGGYLFDKYGKDDKCWYMWILVIGMLVFVLLIVFVFLVNNLYMVFVFYVFLVIMGFFYFGLIFLMI